MPIHDSLDLLIPGQSATEYKSLVMAFSTQCQRALGGSEAIKSLRSLSVSWKCQERLLHLHPSGYHRQDKERHFIAYIIRLEPCFHLKRRIAAEYSFVDKQLQTASNNGQVSNG